MIDLGHLSRYAASSGIAFVAAMAAYGPASAAEPARMASKVLEQVASTEVLQATLDAAQPLPLPHLSAPPAGFGVPLDPLSGVGEAAPRVVPGSPGSAGDTGAGGGNEGPSAPQKEADGILKPLDYGVNNLGTLYHYTDNQVDPELKNDIPYRAVGWLVFVSANGGSYRCTAQLISKSIGATAGHCVHDGGNGAAGWIRSATFYPGYSNGQSAAYGSATVYGVTTTSGWYNTGGVDNGYDVGLFTLNKKAGTNAEIGVKTGWLGFCTANCLQTYWYNTQLGYPGNYYSGTLLTESEHLEISDSRDFTYGTGMEGGSSGGGHIANLGDLSASSGSAGQWPYRNILFATTSWGYIDRAIKIGGGSSLSGPGNSNDIIGMWNLACNWARALHGAKSCNLL